MEQKNRRMKGSFFPFGKRMGMMVVCMVLLLQGLFMSVAHAIGVGGGGMYQWSVDLRGYVSNETGDRKSVV